ncbi:MAG: hypothetical protein JWR61_4706 [Ferruginibacter sp.]|uniref:hypothetical protein n=1 Tax=Ferruginibacter sp. TaxID=1940288 RepID=UPI00265A8F86|nr:hypothetical protein [Ferruginibacter sp.]MDB5279751.1 hypothetical protein [Ferruginibacter sp.]
MKNLFNSALRFNRKSFKVHQTLYGVINKAALPFCLLVSISFLFGCEKESMETPAEEFKSASNLAKSTNSLAAKSEGNVVNDYTGLSDETVWELQQARAATARYKKIENALKDGYADIAVDVEGMGHHFMKTTIVDGIVDIREPEILVYNKNAGGEQELVAVEYAVPLTFPKPEGFTGPADVWNGTSGFPLWLLHAWVWSYNPDGVFNWTNSTVHLH